MTGVGRPGSFPPSSSSSSLASPSMSHGAATTRIDDLLNITINMHPPRRNPRASLDQAQSQMLLNTPTSRRASFNSINSGNANFVPRIIRGTSFSPSMSAPSGSPAISFPPSNVAGTIPATVSTPTLPSSSARGPSLSPTRTRRGPSSATSNTPHSNVSHRTVSAPISLLPPSQTSIIIPPPRLFSTSFPRPSYLDFSAFRHILLSEPGSATPPPPDTYRLQSIHASSVATKLRRPMSPQFNNSDEDSNSDRDESTARSNAGRGRTVTPSVHRRPDVDTSMRLPTRWSDGDDRYPSLSVSVDGQDLTFHGAMLAGDKDAAAARTNFPIPPACGVYYYEIKILNKGQKGHIGIGFGVRTVKLSKLPGLEKKSWGYHGEDGFSFASEGEGSVYGPKFTTGDVVGCGIDFSTGQAFFTNNGRLIGPVFNNLTAAGDLYPTVGLRTPNESIRANFGQDRFIFDIDSHADQIRNRTWSTILRTRIGTKVVNGAKYFVRQESGESREKKDEKIIRDEDKQGECIDQPMHDLIMGYLAHHGYSRTSQALKEQFERQVKECSLAKSKAGEVVEKKFDSSHLKEGKLQEEMAVDVEGLSLKKFDSSSIEDSALLQLSKALTPSESATRQSIIRAIICGKIDTALAQTKKYYPDVLSLDEGMILFKLRCRQFVELVLEAAMVSKKGMQTRKGKERERQVSDIDQEYMDMDTDVDYYDSATVNGGGAKALNGTMSNGGKAATTAVTVDAMTTLSNGTNGASSKFSEAVLPSSAASALTISQHLLQSALSLGQGLQADYKTDSRQQVQNIYKSTLGLVAYENPFGDEEEESGFDLSSQAFLPSHAHTLISENGSSTAAIRSVPRNEVRRKHIIPESVREMVSQSARDRLAEEVNRAILESQGKPPHPALERLYRHTQACVVQLAWLGVGAAAFADIPREFLED